MYFFDWGNVVNKPSTIAGYGILDALQLGNTSLTAYRGDYGATAYAHSQVVNGSNPHFTTFASLIGKPSTLAGYGITDGASQGVAYSNLENNVKVVQGVPAGGKMHLGVGIQTGAIKIKLPKAKSNTMFKFRVRMNGYASTGKQSNAEYLVKGYNYGNGFGYDTNSTSACQVTTIKDNFSLMSPVFYFCNGSTEDYILIGGITDTHVHKSVVIDNVEIHFTGIADDWSKDWDISLVTTLETLTSTFKVAVTPSLNATHLNGLQEDTSATPNTIAKRDTSGFITPSQTLYNPYNITAIYGKNYVFPASGGQKITLPVAVENKVIEIYKANTSINSFLGITGTDVIYDVAGNDMTTQLTTSGGFSKFKYARFIAMKTATQTGNDTVIKWVFVEFKTVNFVEDVINDVFNFLKKITIKSTDTTALDVQNASGTSVFTVDTTNQVVTGSAVDTTATANTIVKRDATGRIVTANGTSNGTIFSQTNTVTVTNTVTETSLIGTGSGSVTIPANSLQAGSVIRVKTSGLITTGTSQQSTIKFKLGSTTLLTNLATLPNNLSNNKFEGTVDLLILTTGATGTAKVIGSSNIIQGNSSVFSRVLDNLTAITIDTTQALAIGHTYTWTTASAGNSITTHETLIEKIN